MVIRLQEYSYRSAAQVINSRLTLGQEIERILNDPHIDCSSLSRPDLNELLEEKSKEMGWESQPAILDEPADQVAKIDILKERVGIEEEFGHSSFIGNDILKFQLASYFE